MRETDKTTTELLIEQWRRAELLGLLYNYVHSGRSGRRFRPAAEALETLESEYRADWEELTGTHNRLMKHSFKQAA